MNKKIILTLLPLMALTACNKSAYKLDLKVATPSGSPATAFIKYLGDTEHLEVNSSADNVLAYFTSVDTNQKKDIIVAPTNGGIAKIKAGAEFQIAATLTFGNFFLLSTGLDDDEQLDEGDKVLAFQQNGVAGKLFNYVYGDRNLDVTYLDNAVAVKNEVLTNKNLDADYFLLAQPVVAAVLSQKENFKIARNVQADYQEKTGGKEITQASIFIRKGTDEEVANNFLKAIEKDVNELIKNPEKFIANYAKDIEDEVFSAKMTGTKQLITKLLTNNNQIGLGFKNAFENKAAIDNFIGTLGMPATNEEIYFRSSK